LSDYNLNQICNISLPALKYFEIWLGRRLWHKNICIESLNPVLYRESFPNLRYLGLLSSEYSDLLAANIVDSQIIEHLSVLDLSMGNLTDYGAKLLLNNQAVNQLHTLNISNNCVSHQIVKKLYELNCRLIADKQEDDFEQGCGRSRYYALHE
jgi:hypothetical protein